QAVAIDRPDPTALRELIQDDWTWLSTWKYEIDEPAAEYLGARYALTALWTNIQLAPDIDQKGAFKLINDKCVRGRTALSRTLDRPFQAALMMRFTRYKSRRLSGFTFYSIKNACRSLRLCPKRNFGNCWNTWLRRSKSGRKVISGGGNLHVMWSPSLRAFRSWRN